MARTLRASVPLRAPPTGVSVSTGAGVVVAQTFFGDFATLYEAHAKFHTTVTPPLVAAVFLGALFGLVLLIGSYWGNLGLVIAFLFGGVGVLISYFFSDKIAIASMHGQQVDEQQTTGKPQSGLLADQKAPRA